MEGQKQVPNDSPRSERLAWVGRGPEPGTGNSPQSPKRIWEEEMRALAEAGDFDAILQRLQCDSRSVHDRRVIWRYLAVAMENACGQNPRSFSARVFPALISFALVIRMRLECVLTQMLEPVERGRIEPSRFHSGETEKALNYYTQMVQLNAELLRSMAATERLWNLAEKGKRPHRNQLRAEDVEDKTIDVKHSSINGDGRRHA